MCCSDTFICCDMIAMVVMFITLHNYSKILCLCLLYCALDHYGLSTTHYEFVPLHNINFYPLTLIPW